MPKKKKTTWQKALRLAGVAVVLAAFGVLGWLGYEWQANLKVEAVELVGPRHADRAALLELARVDTSMRLFDVEPALIADRVRRHPWIEGASVTRLPTGTLHIRVAERTPVVLALSEEGRPSHYLDADGFQMPLDSGAVYDVPLLSGLEAPYHPVQPVRDDTVRTLLRALAGEPHPLVSELELREGDVWLHTAPSGGHGSVPVRLGSERFARKLTHLRVFWQEAVRTQPEKTFELIDLRFDGQIVTREHFSLHPDSTATDPSSASRGPSS